MLAARHVAPPFHAPRTAVPGLARVLRGLLWRGTAFAVYFAAMYLLGGAFGPAAVGALSDHLATTAMHTAGSTAMSETFKAAGLYGAMYLVPVMLGATALFVYLASRCFAADARAMRAASSSSPPETDAR